MDVLINRLGARGDGIAETVDGPVYVPFALPGEKVSVRVGKSRGDGLAADLRDVLSPSADRQAAMCRHFGPGENGCGGCVSQHLVPGAYTDWKRGVVRYRDASWQAVQLSPAFWRDLAWWRDTLAQPCSVSLIKAPLGEAAITGTGASDYACGELA